MGFVEIFYTVKYTDNGEVAEKRSLVAAANSDVYEEGFNEGIANKWEYSEYQTGRKHTITAFRIVRPEVVESKSASSNRGIL